MRGRGGRAVAQHVGGDGFDDLDVEIGRGQLQPALGRLDQDIRQNRDRVAPLDHALHMSQRLQESAAFNIDLHRAAGSRNAL